MITRYAVRLAAVIVLQMGLCFLSSPAVACPFCSAQGQTLTSEIAQASIVVYGSLSNAKLDANAQFGQGTTDLQIEKILKSHEILADQKIVTLPRYLPLENGNKRMLVFCDVFKGKLDWYAGRTVNGDGEIVRYLEGALAVKDKDMTTRLKFFFNYLDSKDPEISGDAYKEFAYADYKDFEPMAKALPADKIAKWLADPDTPQNRYGLYASMLGHCGTESHVATLQKLLDDPQRRVASGVDGVLAGFIMLKPKAGWEYVRGLINDPSKEFMLRYAALRAIRFFRDFRPDLAPPKASAEAVDPLLDQNDIADLAIEDLRKWKNWEVEDRIAALYGKPSHDVPIIRRAIVRYMLACPGPKAAGFVNTVRQKDPEMVKDIEELLKLEATPPPMPPKVKGSAWNREIAIPDQRAACPT